MLFRVKKGKIGDLPNFDLSLAPLVLCVGG